ncbi:MAG: hypothetical protein KAQ78_08030, partial [Candidatus Latescibacteria bacterium]|nr:hypothetical protein [Candidatus Latescibacterota bacterium]
MTQSTNWKSRMSSKIHHALNELRRIVRQYPRAFKLVWQADRKYTVFLLGLTALTSVTAPAQIWLTKLIIDATSALITGSQANPTEISNSILILVFLVLAVWILANAVKMRLYMVQDILGLKVQYHVQYLIMQKASGLDAVFYETPRFYDMLENARRAAGSKPLNLMSRFSTFLEQGLSLVAMLVILGRLHPLAPVVLLLLAGPWATAES